MVFSRKGKMVWIKNDFIYLGCVYTVPDSHDHDIKFSAQDEVWPPTLSSYEKLSENLKCEIFLREPRSEKRLQAVILTMLISRQFKRGLKLSLYNARVEN